MAYLVVGVRECETMKAERDSILVAIAKARIWDQEGWQVHIADAGGRLYHADEFEGVWAAATGEHLTFGGSNQLS